MFIGRAKRPLGRSLHDKVLMADARMSHADWLTAAAAIVGVLGMLHDLVIMPVEGFGEGDRPGEEIRAVEEDGGASKEDDGP